MIELNHSLRYLSEKDIKNKLNGTPCRNVLFSTMIKKIELVLLFDYGNRLYDDSISCVASTKF